MATENPTVPIAPNTDDATFQSWVSAIDSAITALGLVVTGDTGQINPATVARPTAGNYAGYRMYRFADALQAAAPCFIKIEYGISANTGSAGKLAITVGTGTNGAGTLSGQVGSRRLSDVTALPEAGQDAHCYFSGDTGRLQFALYATSANGRVIAFSVERSKDTSGTRTGDALIAQAMNWNTQGGDVIGSPGVLSTATVFGMAAPPSDTTAVNGADVICFTAYPPPRFSRYALQGFVGFLSADISVGTQFSCDPDGNGAHTYIALTTFANSTPASGVNTNSRYAIRYD